MFNTPRWHRLLTVPALVVALAVLFFSPYPVYALAVCPLMIALPNQLHAAWRADAKAMAGALTATRVTGYLGTAWGLVILFVVPAAGVIMLLAFIAMLALAGSADREPRLAGVMMLEGVLLSVAGVPLVWLGATYVLLIPTGVVLFAGATWWLVEATRAPVTDRIEPELPIAIAV